MENHYGPRGHESVIKALRDSKLGTVLAHGIYELNALLDELKETPDEALEHAEALVKKHHGKEDGRLITAATPTHIMLAENS